MDAKKILVRFFNGKKSLQQVLLILNVSNFLIVVFCHSILLHVYIEARIFKKFGVHIQECVQNHQSELFSGSKVHFSLFLNKKAKYCERSNCAFQFLKMFTLCVVMHTFNFHCIFLTNKCVASSQIKSSYSLYLPKGKLDKGKGAGY